MTGFRFNSAFSVFCYLHYFWLNLRCWSWSRKSWSTREGADDMWSPINKQSFRWFVDSVEIWSSHFKLWIYHRCSSSDTNRMQNTLYKKKNLFIHKKTKEFKMFNSLNSWKFIMPSSLFFMYTQTFNTTHVGSVMRYVWSYFLFSHKWQMSF